MQNGQNHTPTWKWWLVNGEVFGLKRYVFGLWKRDFWLTEIKHWNKESKASKFSFTIEKYVPDKRRDLGINGIFFVHHLLFSISSDLPLIYGYGYTFCFLLYQIFYINLENFNAQFYIKLSTYCFCLSFPSWVYFLSNLIKYS